MIMIVLLILGAGVARQKIMIKIRIMSRNEGKLPRIDSNYE